MLKLWMAPAGLHIEPARPGDAEAMARLHAQGFYRGWSAEEFSGFLADPEATPAYVATDARRQTIAGFALFRLAAGEAELLSVAVERKWQGKRIGRALLDAALDDLRHTPTRRIFLEVAEDNAPAIKLYRNFGFNRVGVRKGYYPRPDGTPATALVMARDLG